MALWEQRRRSRGEVGVNRWIQSSARAALLFTLPFALACRSLSEPNDLPESSLPGSGAVAAHDQKLENQAAHTEVPTAPLPDEASRKLPEPDPDTGAGTLLMYTVITGHRPFDPAQPRGGTSAPDRWTASGEASRGDSLEAQIEEELRRQREALNEIDVAPGRPTIESLITGESLAERANPRIAPGVPEEPEYPEALFESQRVTIVAGSWGNDESIQVWRRVLDADQDGIAEEIRFYDLDGETLLRREVDTNYDGILDTQNTYRAGKLIARTRDTNDDGQPDVWERYANERMAERTIDRNRDGVPDAFYKYSGETLVEERHDGNDDGVVDRRITYKDLYRVYAEEDRNRDGSMDTWTRYGVSQGNEVVTRVERASKGEGRPDVVEIYDTKSGQSVISKREEDRNGDGTVDVTSHYENGKLVQREINDPSLEPL
jgi:hypothetical protein